MRRTALPAALAAAPSLIVILGFGAWAEPGRCFERFSGLCPRLAADERVMLRTYPGDVFLPNPARSGGEIVSHEPLRAAIARGPDKQNLHGKIKVVFASLTSSLMVKLASLPDGHPTKTALLRKVKAVSLRTRDTDRCRGRDRPYYASFDGRSVLICSWMTHLAVEAMFTTLAHELGHLIDPCAGTASGPAPFATLPPFPAERAQNCSSDGELFADKVSGMLTEELLGFQKLAGGGVFDYPSQPEDRAAGFLFYGLHPTCRVTPGDGRLGAFFDRPGLQGFLGCLQ